jgi:hypothetical protein
MPDLNAIFLRGFYQKLILFSLVAEDDNCGKEFVEAGPSTCSVGIKDMVHATTTFPNFTTSTRRLLCELYDFTLHPSCALLSILVSVDCVIIQNCLTGALLS